MQYVGETKQKLRTRIGQHKRSIENRALNSYLVQHFSSNGHCTTDITVQIIEKLETSNTEKETKANLESRELFWIKALNTAYPFGLNDRIKGYGDISSGLDPTSYRAHPYFQIPVHSARRRTARKAARTHHRQSTAIVPTVFYALLDPICDARKVYKTLATLSLRNLALLNQEIIRDGGLLSPHIRLAALAVIASRVSIRTSVADKSKQMFIPAAFVNQGMDFVKIHTIFKDATLFKTLEIDRKFVGKITVTYQHDKSNFLKYASHSKELRNLTTESLAKILSNKCECANSSLCYQPVGHIVTGNLNVIEDVELRQTLLKGANHREVKKINWSEVEDSAMEALETLISKLSRQLKKNNREFQKFREYFSRILKQRIEYWKPKIRDLQTEGQITSAQLKKVTDKYVLTVADKAANNFIVVCKKFYMLTLCRELGVNFNEQGITEVRGNGVYEKYSEHEHKIVKIHKMIAQKYKCTVGEADAVLPVIFATAKLHKVPIKFRFIAGARVCSMKQISVLLADILKHFRQHLASYCKTIAARTGIQTFWSVDGNVTVVNGIRKIKAIQKATTADFSTLYTSLPHTEILSNMYFLVDLLFRNSGKWLLAIGTKRQTRKCWFTDDRNAGCLTLTSVEVKELIRDVVDNSFVKFAGLIFKQVSGIPMGNNASPLIADLTLATMEFRFMTDKKNDDVRYSIKHMFRYMDDLLGINVNDAMNIWSRIYPPQLPLSKTSVSDNKCSYLDIELVTENNETITRVYNKTDDFNFPVVRYTHCESNTSIAIGLNTFYSQLIRIGRISSDRNSFTIRVKELYKAFVEKRYNHRVLIQRFRSFAKNYKPLVLKFKLVTKQDIQDYIQTNLAS